MERQFLRSFGRLCGWIIITGGALTVNVALIYANYASLKKAFELSNFESRPLGTDELLGWLFGAFVPTATVADAYALTMAMTIATGQFFVCKCAFELSTLWADRRVYLREGDQRSADHLLWLIYTELATMFVLLALLAPAIYWDVELFVFRTLCGVLNIVDPTNPEDAAKIANLPQTIELSGNVTGLALAHIGAWGYIALTTVMVLCLEAALRRTANMWKLLEVAVFGSLQPADFVGAAVDQGTVPVSPQSVPEPLVVAPATMNGHGPGTAVQEPHPPLQAESEPLPAASPHTSSLLVKESVASAQELRFPVVGGNGEEVTMSDALAHPERYWIDPDTRQIWDLRFRQSMS